MDRKFKIAVAVLLCLNLAWAASFISHSLSVSHERSRAGRLGDGTLDAAVKYTLYVGLNDKDAHSQLVTDEEAERRLNEVAIRHADGFTVRRARGFWRDDDGLPTSENTLVYDFIDLTEERLAAILGGMLEAMNQSSILVEKNETRRLFHK